MQELPSDCQISHEDLEAELDDLPKYEAIKRNIYLSKERPKRMAKSKIQVTRVTSHLPGIYVTALRSICS